VTAFSVAREVRAPAAEMWELLVDWPRHAGWVPLTTMSVGEDGGHGVGATFVARTRLGPLGFDDVLRVVAWRPPERTSPGRVRVVHEGAVVGGSAEVEVRPITGSRCVATWWEDVVLAPRLPRGAAGIVGVLSAPVSVLAGRLVFGRMLRLAADQAEQSYAITAGEGR
jgi:polyketide cyclase/dehydrase/lipid transport protein